MPNLAAKEYCTGCTACASVCPKDCIAMTTDENSFWGPTIDTEQCIACGQCEKICPVINPPKKAENMPQSYAAYSKNETVRMSSSSGGIFTEIAKAVLEHGGVVFGAAYNEQYEVVHICVENKGDLDKLRGAKYAQSNLNNIFSQIKQRLDMGPKVLFSGTPCQVSGLKAYLRKDYKNLLTVDFVCHSVPSPMAWQEYVKYRAQQDNGGELPTAIDLRSKKTGWSRYQYSNLFEYASGVSYTVKSGESLYMKLFVGGYISRESCENCQFKGYSRVSDLTIGDFWGIWDIAPEMDDNKGTSVILVQSERGEELLQGVSAQLILKPVTLEEASWQNSAMLNASPPNGKRLEVLELIRTGKISYCEKIITPAKPKIVQKIRSVAGRVLRRGRS